MACTNKNGSSSQRKQTFGNIVTYVYTLCAYVMKFYLILFVFHTESVQLWSGGFLFFRSVTTFTAITYEKGCYERTKEFRQI